MKLMTINTHSLIEKNYTEKLCEFVSAVCEKKPHIIAMQEVNQSLSADVIPEESLAGYFPCREGIVLRADNHVYNVAELLRKKGLEYYWSWLPIKCGYGKYEEGIALMSSFPITQARVVAVSRTQDYLNWKTRKIIGIKTCSTAEEWFFSVHYGWWKDEEEPFERQWKNTLEQLPENSPVWLMGDFNNPADIRGEGYDMMISDGWHDSYAASESKDDGITVGGVIDGWRDKTDSSDGMRIDLIMSNTKRKVLSSEVVFNGRNFSVVSDHFGVLVNYADRF